uniref:Uncharacterized protein n=1 Tax=Solanum lycopersicum TaxID=4081 RepID=A0A494G8B8_SOLLC
MAQREVDLNQPIPPLLYKKKRRSVQQQYTSSQYQNIPTIARLNGAKVPYVDHRFPHQKRQVTWYSNRRKGAATYAVHCFVLSSSSLS